jgi:hypothetical protein
VRYSSTRVHVYAVALTVSVDPGGMVTVTPPSAVGVMTTSPRTVRRPLAVSLTRGHLVTVERFGTPAEVDCAEPGDDLGWHQSDQRIKVGEAAQGTS